MYYLRNLAIKRMRIMAMNMHDPEVMKFSDSIMDHHDPDVGCYARRTKEWLADRLNLAYEDNDPYAFLNVEEYFLDQCTLEENRVYNAGIAASQRVMDGLDRWDVASVERIMTKIFDAIIEVEAELSGQPVEGA